MGCARRCTDTQMENEIIKAVRTIIGQLYQLTDLNLPPRQIDRIRRETIFFLYEGGNAEKWSPHRPHSSKARHLHDEVIKERRRRQFSGTNDPITYDHAIPLATLHDGLREAAASTSQMRTFLHKHIQGVVILRDENASLNKLGLRSDMPSDAAPDDLMARYEMAGIHFESEDLTKRWPLYLA